MRDPWKYLAFPIAAIIGYLASLGLTSVVANSTGLAEGVAKFAVIGGTGLVAGFMIDEVIPAYIEKIREGGSGGDMGGDFGGGGGDDDFGGDMDFG
ncbi:hypothetical protein ACK3SF_00460 [Candidatus Nanosalina sp. VS9-1]|uniref:hypothetical protein n=1 Tax=Candidatus Nanosalina sp. VS9-1 TaxID=3388566 RepID=UPI0039E0F36B